MKTLKAIITLCCIAAFGAGIATLNVDADTWNKKTIITITEPMQIPGATLTPGKYVFKLMDSSSNRHIVQVFNEDETQRDQHNSGNSQPAVAADGKERIRILGSPCRQHAGFALLVLSRR